MQLCKFQLETKQIRVGAVMDEHVRQLDLDRYIGLHCLSDVLHSPDPAALAQELIDEDAPSLPLRDAALVAPIDQQEVWAAGVTYKRSEEARKRESSGAARFYDLVYTAPRPELFFKATPHRVAAPGARVRVRADSRWSVPEPELALVLSPQLQLVGYTIGNDMSARDIEGENPLYLPQAKVYHHCCALGPVITLARSGADPSRAQIRLHIERLGRKVFEGSTAVSQMARSFQDLIGWLGKDNSFPNGAILLTGTGIVPPDDFTLEADDRITIEIDGIGRLCNIVEKG
jgi:2-dehydro-3-deoxy-D-arabinonate dehydratase